MKLLTGKNRDHPKRQFAPKSLRDHIQVLKACFELLPQRLREVPFQLNHDPQDVMGLVFLEEDDRETKGHGRHLGVPVYAIVPYIVVRQTLS